MGYGRRKHVNGEILRRAKLLQQAMERASLNMDQGREVLGKSVSQYISFLKSNDTTIHNRPRLK